MLVLLLMAMVVVSVTGIITATSFSGDGSSLTNIDAGISAGKDGNFFIPCLLNITIKYQRNDGNQTY